MKFFADRGHNILIAGYYDARPAQVRAWLDADKSIEHFSPVMYTTWQRNYRDLEAFAEVVDTYR